jgi:hypothetical protein
MHVREMTWEGVEWFNLVQDRIISGIVEHGNFLLCSKKCREFKASVIGFRSGAPDISVVLEYDAASLGN